MIFSLIASYLVGSIPTAYIFGRLYKGIDIREHGSGNIGATNTFRVLGKVPGICVLIVDVFKGIVATTLIADIFHLETTGIYVLLGVCAVAGHNWTVFLKFKGGKGIATTLGVIIGLAIKILPIRPVFFWVILIWLVIFLISGYVSLSSILAGIALPLIMLITGQEIEIVFLGIILCLLSVLRHRPNIKRLLTGKENRVKMPHLSQK